MHRLQTLQLIFLFSFYYLLPTKFPDFRAFSVTNLYFLFKYVTLISQVLIALELYVELHFIIIAIHDLL